MKRKRYCLFLSIVLFPSLTGKYHYEVPTFQPRWAKLGTASCTGHKFSARVFGSRSEAKRALARVLPTWPDAKIVPEVSL